MEKSLAIDGPNRGSGAGAGAELSRSWIYQPELGYVADQTKGVACQNRFLRRTPTRAELSTKGCRRQAEEMRKCLRTWLQRMCCALAIPASLYFGGLRDRETEVRQRSELPEGRGEQRRTEGSSQEVFKMIFELRDNPLSVRSTYSLHRICIVTGKRRRDIAET